MKYFKFMMALYLLSMGVSIIMGVKHGFTPDIIESMVITQLATMTYVIGFILIDYKVRIRIAKSTHWFKKFGRWDSESKIYNRWSYRIGKIAIEWKRR